MSASTLTADFFGFSRVMKVSMKVFITLCQPPRSSFIVVDMNPPTIHQTRPERQSRVIASTSTARAKEHEDAAVRQDPAMCKAVVESSHDGVRAAITNASVLLSGDQLVVSVAEAGRLLGVSRAFAYELAARGELPTIHLGRRIVVPKVALLAMVGLSFPQP